MKRAAILWLIGALILTAAGCTGRGGPAAAPGASQTPTPGTAPPTLTPAPSPAPTPTPTPSPTPPPAEPPAVRWTRGTEEAQYTLLVGQGDAAKALGDWLQGPGAALAAAYVPAGLGEPIYTLRFTPAEGTPDIPPATEETRELRLAVDSAILDSGLLAALLPDFEGQYGYSVEVYAGEGALSGGVGAALLADGAAAGLAGEFGVQTPYLSTTYVPAA